MCNRCCTVIEIVVAGFTRVSIIIVLVFTIAIVAVVIYMKMIFLLKSKLFQLLTINILLAKLLLQFVFFRCIHRHVVAVVLMQSRSCRIH